MYINLKCISYILPSGHHILKLAYCLGLGTTEEFLGSTALVISEIPHTPYTWLIGTDFGLKENAIVFIHIEDLSFILFSFNYIFYQSLPSIPSRKSQS